MRTIPRHFPGKPNGGYRAECVVCRAKRYRKDLVRRDDGVLTCRRGPCRYPSKLELARAEAGAAREAQLNDFHTPDDRSW